MVKLTINIMENMTYNTLSDSQVLLLRLVANIVEEVVVMVDGQVVAESAATVAEEYVVTVAGFDVAMVAGFYCCHGCCVCCCQGCSCTCLRFSKCLFPSSELFADNEKNCYDTAFNVALKFVEFLLHCKSCKLCPRVIFSALGR